MKRDTLASARNVLVLGILLTLSAPAFGQEPTQPESTAPSKPAATVTGRVFGETLLRDSETLAILLMPGWSEKLSADIAAGTAPVIQLQSGMLERVVATPPGRTNPEGPTGSFEFRNIPPGEYQAVAIRVRDGGVSGAAVAESSRVIVEERDIADLELKLTPLPIDQPGRRHGGALEREAEVMNPTILDPPARIVIAPPPPRTRPVGNPGGVPVRFPTSSGKTTKKDILGHIFVGVGIAVLTMTFTKW